jgi:hypothetical protein
MRNKAIAAFIAVFAILGFSLASASPASAAADTCKNTTYPDGALMSRVCFDVINDAGSGFHVTTTVHYNVPLAEGGHSDSMVQLCMYTGHDCYDPLGLGDDGETRTISDNFYQSDSNTIWVRVKMLYGGAYYCRSVYVTATKAISAATVAC